MNQKEPEVVLPSKVLSEMEETDVSRVLTQKTKIALIAHFVNMVPIENLNIDKRTKDIIARVDHVYWLYKKNPFLDTHAMFYQMYKAMGRGTGGNSTLFAKRDDKMLEFVIDQVKPDSRRRDEMKVRHVADRLMERGLATDNDRAMAKGADLLTRVARLDQPESEQVDLNRLSFLPPVVTTSAKEVGDYEDVDDKEMKRIMEKYGGYVDEKERDIERMVETMAARSSAPAEEVKSEE
jgi:hypothetical protein